MSNSSPLRARLIPVSGSGDCEQPQQPHSHEQHEAIAWPRSWQDGAAWRARDPAVAGSLTGSFIRSTHPQLLDAELEARGSPSARRALLSQDSADGRAEGATLQATLEASDEECGEHEQELLFELDEDVPGAERSRLLARGPARAASIASAASQGSALLGAAQRLGSGPLAKGGAGEAAQQVLQADAFTLVLEDERSTSSTWQAAFNAVNILCGVGLLTTPYALAQTGVAALLLLVAVGTIACFTGRLLAKCMDASGSKSYPDIGQAAFGNAGRLLVSLLLYCELFSCCVDFLILEGDNLAAVFPGARLSLPGLQLGAKQALILLAALVVLPTVWLRDLSLLSFLSVGGIFASLALLALVAWEGAAVTGFPHTQPPLVSWPGVPVSIGLFCFCFSGHAVFPSLYASMRRKSHFSWLLVGSFVAVILIYGSMAVLGAAMFGSEVRDNITLNMQDAAPHAIQTVVAMWLTVINPVAKIALTLAPVAMALEELIPRARHGSWEFAAASLSLRTALLLLAVVVAVCIPWFAAVSSLIGAAMSMSISIVLPCVFALRVCVGRARLSALESALALSVGAFGVVAGTTATAHALRGIAGKY